jgi:hypothetical protein
MRGCAIWFRILARAALLDSFLGFFEQIAPAHHDIEREPYCPVSGQ